MRPVSLAIEGLTSFREPQEVDFSELGLFVITGPTGAGKSSILDAMTFALYGRIARVNSHELRDLISHGCADMRVRLDFEADGVSYRVARRMGKSRHDVSLERVDDSGSASELERGGVQAVNGRLEEIIGLDFGAFTKAVLLPQGEFDEFLRGDKAERRRILTRLLDLNRYERAGQTARREATRLDAVVGEREALIESNYQDATKEHLGELKKSVKAARDQHAKLEQARNQAKEIATTAASARQAIAALGDTAHQLEESCADLEELGEAWPPLEVDGAAAEQGLAQIQATLKESERELERTRKQVAATAKRTGDTALLARLEEAASTLSRETEDLSEIEAALVTAREEAVRLEEARHAAESDNQEKKKAGNERTKARARAEAEEQLAQAIVDCVDRAAAVTMLDTRLDPARQEAQDLQAQVDQARQQVVHVEHEHSAVALRATLQPGDPCPVCATVIKTLPKSDRGTEALLVRERQALEKVEMRALQAKENVVALEADRKTAALELEKARANLPKSKELPTRKEAAGALSAAKRAASAARRAEADAQAALEKAARRLAEAQMEAATAQERADGLGSKRNDAKKRIETARRTLSEGFAGKLPRDIAAAIGGRREELTAIERARDQAGEAVEAARLGYDEAQAVAKAAAERISAFDNEFAKVRTAARIACNTLAGNIDGQPLPAIPSDGAKQAEAVASWNDCCTGHLTSARKAIAAKEKDVAAAGKELERVAATAGVTVTAAEPAEMEAELEQAVTASHGAVVAAEKDVETAKKRIDERKQLEAAIVADRSLRTLYNALATDLRADHFLAWVLEESMNQLAEEASVELLSISADRYSLVADQGNFDVIDHTNADERRSVATLSGGETFLASLSLALALAAGLRELASAGAARLDAVFIDEGFGALDPETLAVVVDALERLQQGDRMVGVITHVPDLAERIRTGLLVETNGGSSRIVTR
jgi:exonuclease SbcC